MIIRVVIFVLCIGPWCGTYGQEFTFSMAARCSIPLNDPARPSYLLDLGYADTSWTIDWLRIDYASAYLFQTIGLFTVEERTRSVGLACGLHLYRRERFEMRTGLQLRFSRTQRYVGVDFSNYDDGTYIARSVGFEVPMQIALRLGRSSPFQVFAEAVPGYVSVLYQRIYDRPDPSMRVRNSLALGVLVGFRIQVYTR